MLNFEYCECGCHCHSASSKGMNYSIYNDLRGSYKVYNGHGRWGVLIGDFDAFRKAAAAAQKHFDDTP